jgi:NADP-dependent 3-hydroxy acid dehydrogenase YdfG
VADLVNISSTAGRVARPDTSVYALTKFGIGAFSESVRQEVLGKHVRVSLVEPGRVDTEISTHLPREARAAVDRQNAEIEMLQASDIADAVLFVVTRDRRVAVNEVLVRATEQTW